METELKGVKAKAVEREFLLGADRARELSFDVKRQLSSYRELKARSRGALDLLPQVEQFLSE